MSATDNRSIPIMIMQFGRLCREYLWSFRNVNNKYTNIIILYYSMLQTFYIFVKPFLRIIILSKNIL